METTTIQISKELKESIKSFGAKGESYDEILRRWEKIATIKIFHDFLYDNSNSVSIEEAKKIIKE